MGDVLLHGPLQSQGYKASNGFHSLWSKVERIWSGADVTYANMEGPVAGPMSANGKLMSHDPGKKFDQEAYTGYPRFNYHPSILFDLKSAGADVISTANNHAMDRGSLGADRTIDNILHANLLYSGTRKKGDTDSPWHTVSNENGVRIAWLACSYDTNGIDDPHRQVLLCFHDTSLILKIVKDLAHDSSVDAVIVTPHWGSEYESSPNTSQKNLAKQLIEAGATAVIGSHPHVLQPWAKITASDGREGLVIYSLGNFVSNQRELIKRTSLMLHLGLTIDPVTRKAFVNGARITPIAMDFDHSPYTLELASASHESDSYKHVVSLFGDKNLSKSQLDQGTTRIVPNPECF